LNRHSQNLGVATTKTSRMRLRQVRIDLGEVADFSVRRNSMSLKVMTLTVSLAGIVKVMARYLPEYTASGDLVLPKNCREWVYVGSRSNRTRSMAVRPMSPRITTATSSRARASYTKRPAYFPTGPSYLKSCTLRCRRKPRRFPSRAVGQGVISRCHGPGFQAQRLDGGMGNATTSHEPRGSIATLKPKEECASLCGKREDR
jgi:hypothetical protein